MQLLRSMVRRIDPYVWLVIAFSLFVVLPLAGPVYFFNAHDARHSVFFFTEFDAALRDRVWYPGWATDHAWGYGYPTFVFYPPLAQYVAEVFHLLGAGKVAAVKWTWALATLGSGLAMYAYGRAVLGRQRGLLAAIVYVYVPYHLADIYVRGALGEYCAFVWMPLTLLAFHRLVQDVTARRLALAGLAYGALWMTHNVTGLAFTPLLAAYVLFRLVVESVTWQRSRGGSLSLRIPSGQVLPLIRRALGALGGAMLGLGVAAALLLPNLFERSYINQGQFVQSSYDYSQHFVYPFQFLSPFWGYAPAGPGPQDGMSFQLGAVPVIFAAVAVVAVWRRSGSPRRPRSERALALFLAGATVVLVFLMLSTSGPVWAMVPVAALIQFPWRLLALTSVTLSILAGLALPRAKSAALLPQVLILALVAILGSISYTVPEYTPIPESAEGPLLSLEFEQEYPDMVGMTAWAVEQPSTSPLVEQYQAEVPLVTAVALAPGASVEMIRAGGASDELWVRSRQGTPLRFFTYYFPGWRVYVDGERLPESALRAETAHGLLTVDVAAGEHHVLLRWGDTRLRLLGKGLTLVCLGLSLVLHFPWRSRRRSDPLQAPTFRNEV